ncbi:MAG: molybdopterin-guanine dinucleotide biosynthesis protein MobB [Candidatus Hermodarchaeota archaeon]
MKPRILALVGPKNAGKTRFLEQYIPLLRTQGKTIGTIKCAAQNTTFDFDNYEFDVERHRKAGSQMVIFRSPITTAIVHNHSTPMEYALRQLEDLDYIFIEGQPEDIKGFPQLVFVNSQAEIKDFLTDYTTGITSLEEHEQITHPLFQSFDNLLSMIETKALPELPHLDCSHCGMGSCDEMLKAIIRGEKTLEDCEPLQTQEWSFQLIVNGKEVPCVHFVQEMIREGFLGAVKTLKGVQIPIENISFQVKKT